MIFKRSKPYRRRLTLAKWICQRIHHFLLLCYCRYRAIIGHVLLIELFFGFLHQAASEGSYFVLGALRILYCRLEVRVQLLCDVGVRRVFIIPALVLHHCQWIYASERIGCTEWVAIASFYVELCFLLDGSIVLALVVARGLLLHEGVVVEAAFG